MSSVFSPVRSVLLSQFEDEARTAAASVERVRSSASELRAAVERVARGRIAISEPLDLPTDLFSEARKLPGVILGRSKQELATCDVGITDAFAGVARTGSVCVTIDHDYAGPISLLTRLHIAVLSADVIVERPSDLFRPDCLEGKGGRRNFVFVTGPSATADMGPLVRGVHGPHQLHIVIVE
jgi:L-lactate dehydrogenase complex protein LldG